MPRRTKIVATLGPATDGKGVLVNMIQAGMDVVSEALIICHSGRASPDVGSKSRNLDVHFHWQSGFPLARE